MKKLDFVLIGAQKSGTTSLYEYLKQHPEIYLPDTKEIHYFCDFDKYEKGLNYLKKFYKSHDKSQGLAYVHMLQNELAPRRVYEHNPGIKIIVVLREPIDRAVSAYKMAIKNGWEKSETSFEYSIQLEKERLKSNNLTKKRELAYFYNGLYFKHLERWLEYFPKESFLIIKSSDLRNKRLETIAKTYNFLEVDEKFNPINTKNFHPAGQPKIEIIHKLLLNKENKTRILLNKLVPQKIKNIIRNNIINPILKLNNDPTKSKIIKYNSEFLTGYYQNDLEKLNQFFNIELNEKKDSNNK